MTPLCRPNSRCGRIARLALWAVFCSAIAPLADAWADPPAFVAETRIAAPRHIGPLQWTETKFDPARPLSGAVFRYRDGSAPDATIVIVVHAAGDGAPAAALKNEMLALLERQENGARNAGHIGYAIDDNSAFSVKLPPRPVRSMTFDIESGTPRKPPAGDGAVPAEPKLYPQKPIRGARVTATYRVVGAADDAGSPETKYIYLFNRHMHFIRATVTFSGSPPERANEKAADRMVTDLVSRLGIENIGDCGNTTAYNRQSDPKKLTIAQVFSAMDEIDWRGCVADESLAKIVTNEDARGDEIVRIVYSASHWSAP